MYEFRMLQLAMINDRQEDFDGYLEQIKGIIANPNNTLNLMQKDKDGKIILHRAAAIANSHYLQALLKINDFYKNIDLRTKDNDTALTIAIRKRRITNIDILLRTGAGIHIVTGESELHPLTVAIAIKYLEGIKLLLHFGAGLFYNFPKAFLDLEIDLSGYVLVGAKIDGRAIQEILLSSKPLTTNEKIANYFSSEYNKIETSATKKNTTVIKDSSLQLERKSLLQRCIELLDWIPENKEVVNLSYICRFDYGKAILGDRYIPSLTALCIEFIEEVRGISDGEKTKLPKDLKEVIRLKGKNKPAKIIEILTQRCEQLEVFANDLRKLEKLSKLELIIGLVMLLSITGFVVGVIFLLLYLFFIVEQESLIFASVGLELQLAPVLIAYGIYSWQSDKINHRTFSYFSEAQKNAWNTVIQIIKDEYVDYEDSDSSALPKAVKKIRDLEQSGKVTSSSAIKLLEKLIQHYKNQIETIRAPNKYSNISMLLNVHRYQAVSIWRVKEPDVLGDNTMACETEETTYEQGSSDDLNADYMQMQMV